MHRRARAAATALWLVLVLVLPACQGGSAEEADLILGVGSTPEQQVLGALATAALEDEGLRVGMRTDVGDTVALRRAALSGEIDLYFDYTGAAWALGLGRTAPPTDAGESYEAVAAADAEEGLRWFAPTAVNATLALFVSAADWPGEESATLSWLAGRLSSGEGALCADPDYLSRPSGFAALAEAYAIGVSAVQTIEAGEAKVIEDTAGGRCLAALATTTSGHAVRAGLRPVADDQQLFPAFVVAPVAVEGSAADRAVVRDALRKVTEALDTADLAALNAQVATGADPIAAARGFLDTAGGE